MKRTLWLVLTIALVNTAWAETRYLTSDWEFTNDNQAAEFQLDWPLHPTKGGAEFTLRRSDGSLFLQATIKDTHKKALFAKDNMVGKYRYYHPNGKLKREGTWDKAGTPIGLETEYSELGFPKQVIRYVGNGWYVTEKSYYEDGQLSSESTGYDGKEFKETQFYYPDGKLKEKQYKKTQGRIVKEISDYYDRAGKIERYTEKYGDDPMLEITYNAAGTILEKTTTLVAQERYKKERYNDRGQLTDLTQYVTLDGGFKNDGQQIQSYSGKIAYSLYTKGIQQGEDKTVQDGKVISYGHYKDDKPIGDGFRLDSFAENRINFYQYDSDGEIKTIYSIDLNYIHYDDKGMPVVTLPFNAETRKMPEPGTVWAYSSNGKNHRQIQLVAVKDNIVSYRSGDHDIQEYLNDYTPVSTPESGRKILSFPLTLGKQWKDSYQKQVKNSWGGNAEWEYTYSAEASSYISGIEKVTVAGGTFDTLVIERFIHWTKSNPHHNGKPMTEMTCATKDCKVSGYTKEVLWYSPSIGRGVLKAVAISGAPQLVSSGGQEMRQSANSLVSELTYFGPQPQDNQQMPTPQYAREVSASFFTQGFPLVMNNTWEFMMIHNPLIE